MARLARSLRERLMLDSAILDVAIGLAFLFCMISLAASTLRECVEAFLKTRAVMLERGTIISEGSVDNVWNDYARRQHESA